MIKFNRNGFTERGFDQKGINKYTGNRFDKTGYDINGFNKNGIHRITKTELDEEGFNYQGYDSDGFNKYGFDMYGNSRKSNGKKQNSLDKRATPENNFVFDQPMKTNLRGFYRNGRNKYTRKKYDRRGFDLEGINIETGCKYSYYGYDAYGYDREGYDEQGYNKEGYNKYGFNREGINRDTGTIYDAKGYDAEGFNADGYNREGYDRDGYNKRGYDKEGYDIYGMDKDFRRKGTKRKDKRMVFVEEFVTYGKSIEKFAEYKGTSVEEIREKIEDAKEISYVRDILESAVTNNSEGFIDKIKRTKRELLSGKIGITGVRHLEKMLQLSTPDEKEIILELFIKGASSHKISIMQYKDIYGISKIDSDLPTVIMGNLILLNREVHRSKNPSIKSLSKEMNEEINRIKGYSVPYKPIEGEKVGYVEEDGKTKMIEITDKQRELAKQYLDAIGEFICNKTMQQTFRKMAKGEIDLKTLKRGNAEKELKRLQSEDKELDETILLAKRVIGKNKTKE